MHVDPIHLWYEHFQYSIIYRKKTTVSFKGNTAFPVKILGFFPKPGFIFFLKLDIQNFV